MSTRSKRRERRIRRRRRQLYVIIVLIALFLVMVGILAYQGVSANRNAYSVVHSSESGLEYVDLEAGDGEEARVGDRLVVHYTGWLRTGERFDSSYMRDEPLEFILGRGQVIKGLHEGLVGMKVGGKRQFKVPTRLAVGGLQFVPLIPPDSYLVFDVELLDIK